MTKIQVLVKIKYRRSRYLVIGKLYQSELGFISDENERITNTTILITYSLVMIIYSTMNLISHEIIYQY